MSHRTRVARVSLLLVVIGGILGIFEGSASAAPYKCIEITDPQGHVIDTICIPWPLA